MGKGLMVVIGLAVVLFVVVLICGAFFVSVKNTEVVYQTKSLGRIAHFVHTVDRLISFSPISSRLSSQDYQYVFPILLLLFSSYHLVNHFLSILKNRNK